MLLLLTFAFISGLLTILAPCIWPLLPIILASNTNGGKRKSLGITLGLCLSFALVTLSISYLVKLVPFDPNSLRLIAVVVVGLLGFSLVFPALSSRLEALVSRLTGIFGKTVTKSYDFHSGFITGLALGIIWSPCAGPILATIAALAATQSVNVGVILVTAVYIIGVGIPLLIFSLLGNHLFTKTSLLSPYLGIIQRIFGVIMILTALAIYTNYDKLIQTKLLDLFPSYSSFLNNLESNPEVKKELNSLKGEENQTVEVTNQNKPFSLDLPNLGKAADFVGVTKWLNTDKPLSLKDLKGKVILVDFWTYTCINCIRTLPYVTSWYDKYHEMNFTVIGVHTPEFEFEKNTANVQNAINQYKIHYPVAQDNDYATWQAYQNQYWPAKYLIDANGNLRKFHFGEGEYEEMEKAIQTLINENGQKLNIDLTKQGGEKIMAQTPETYLGLKRLERFASPEKISKRIQNYSYPATLMKNYFAYSGTWELQDEYSQPSPDSEMEFYFNAVRVFLVVTPKTPSDSIRVYLDDALVDKTNQGKDVKTGQLQLDSARLYELIDLKDDPGAHILRLKFDSPGIRIFAFTFG